MLRLLRTLLSILLLGSLHQNPRPLDLPAGGAARSDHDEDPAGAITFYGSTFEGDGFFWALDKSSSMHEDGRWSLLRGEMDSALSQLTPRAHVALTAFSTGVQVWSPRPRAATPQQVASAKGWVASRIVAGQTDTTIGVVTLLQIAARSDKRERLVILVSDGVPNDPPQALVDITTANWEQLPIHGVALTPSQIGRAWFDDLCRLNRGSMRVVD